MAKSQIPVFCQLQVQVIRRVQTADNNLWHATQIQTHTHTQKCT